MIIKLYASISKEAAFEAGLAAGLRGEALEYFKHVCEVELGFAVDAENGAICDVEVTKEFRRLYL